MEIFENYIRLSPKQSVDWNEVDTLKLANEDLLLILSNGQVIKLSNQRPTTVDAAFRAFESYKAHHRSSKGKKS